jgi:hypothetical protein
MTRTWMGFIGCASLALAASAFVLDNSQAAPKEQHAAKGAKAKHQHHHNNGHMLLGAKLKQDGKHAVGKLGARDVTAEVKGGKVVGMAAGDMQGKRVRSKTKMALQTNGLVLAGWTPGDGLVLAQVVDYYQYGYCFDDGVNYDCYWYPPEDVDYQSYTWTDYDPYY